MSDDAIQRLQSNWSDELPRGWMDWRTDQVGGMDVLVARRGSVPRVDTRGAVLAEVLGLVVSPSSAVERYVDEHADGTLDIPKYYSQFPDRGDEPVHSVENSSLWSACVEGALRLLNGNGQYARDGIRLYDCLDDSTPMPCPMLRDDVGCVLIAPALSTDTDYNLTGPNSETD